MNENKKSWTILIGVSVLTVSLIYLFSRPKKKSKFKKKLLSIANEELSNWGNGKIKEGSPDTIDKLRDYWEKGGGLIRNDDFYVNEAWSAAFISYMMRKAGAGDDFKYSVSHSEYITESIRNNKENNSKKIKGYRPEDVTDSVGRYLSHCDLVIKKNKDSVDAVGGNVSNSVKTTRYPTLKGKIDKSKDTKNVFVVIKNTK